VPRTGGLHEAQGGVLSLAPTFFKEFFKFFEMSASKIFRKGEANQKSI
jgi:hypothetical protein